MGQTKTKVIQDLPEQPGTDEAPAPTQVEQEKKAQRVRPPRLRGKRFLEAAASVDRRKRYELGEAIELAKRTSWTKFDGTVEFHVATLSKKGQDAVRGTLVLPSGTPKLPKVAIASDSLIEDIAKGRLEFDVLLAEPAEMPKLAKVAKVLGPKGLMPNPKAGTIVEDAKKAAEEFTKGKIEYRADSLGNIHVAVGKVSWDAAKLKANIEAILKVLPRARLASAVLSSTMGPGIKLAL